MGGHLDCRRAGFPLLSDREVPAVRVVPAIPTFAVDDGFWYSEPEHLDLQVGSLVRVPLGGRRVRGYVVEKGTRPVQRLKPVAARSGQVAAFDAVLMESLRWASRHYVAPLSVLLERAYPPNNPPITKDGVRVSPRVGQSPLPELSAAAANATRRRPLAFVGSTPDGEWFARLAAPVMAAGNSVMIVAPTGAEVAALASRIRETGTVAEVVHADLDARTVTEAWARGGTAGTLLVGTPRVAAWRLTSLGLVVLVEDGRRAMKDRQTPAVHARELLRHRSRREGFALAVIGPTPSIEALGWGPEIMQAPGRPWPLVEVVDRREEPPGGGLLAAPTRRALQAVVKGGGSVFLFAHKRGYAAAMRCASCRTLRRCASCGAAVTSADACRRCGLAPAACAGCGSHRLEALGAGVGRLTEEAARVVGTAAVAAYPTSRPAAVGSERDLADLSPRDLIVMVDFDGLLYGSNYRASEEALRIGARLAGKVGRGRLMVQTQEPDHPAVVGLRKADPIPFLMSELRTRSDFGYPPAGELMVIEARGAHDSAALHAELVAMGGGGPMVLGPAPVRDGSRWLIQAAALDEFKVVLRPAVQRWRDGGITVRIDADPIDL